MTWTCKSEFKLLGPLQALRWNVMAGVGADFWLVTCSFPIISIVSPHERPPMHNCGHFSPDAFLSFIYTFPLQRADAP